MSVLQFLNMPRYGPCIPVREFLASLAVSFAMGMFLADAHPAFDM